MFSCHVRNRSVAMSLVHVKFCVEGLPLNASSVHDTLYSPVTLELFDCTPCACTLFHVTRVVGYLYDIICSIGKRGT
jgi:hypothetical protein